MGDNDAMAEQIGAAVRALLNDGRTRLGRVVVLAELNVPVYGWYAATRALDAADDAVRAASKAYDHRDNRFHIEPVGHALDVTSRRLYQAYRAADVRWAAARKRRSHILGLRQPIESYAGGRTSGRLRFVGD